MDMLETVDFPKDTLFCGERAHATRKRDRLHQCGWLSDDVRTGPDNFTRNKDLRLEIFLWDFLGRIRHRYGTFADSHKSVIVFRVADANHVVRRKPEFLERRAQTRRLVYARRQNHHCALVENDLKLEAHIADDLDCGRFVGFPGRDDNTANRNPRRTPTDQLARELGRRRFGKQLFFAVSRTVQKSAILSDDAVEQIETWEDAEQVVEFPSGHE